ncbi:MAG: transcription antitermination factor NusB [Firmicutes bacterium]|nr:transcription antitermination factor NusB [Bacillota bacterium]
MSISRKQAREAVFKLVYGLGFEAEMEKELGTEELALVSDEMPKGPEFAFIQDTFRTVVDNLSEIDDIIRAKARDFSFERLFRIDLALLRLGIAEMRYTDTPHVVVMSTIIDLAKKYSTQKSVTFVNGVLGSVEGK